jgi:hypothetical protein
MEVEIKLIRKREGFAIRLDYKTNSDVMKELRISRVVEFIQNYRASRIFFDASLRKPN